MKLEEAQRLESSIKMATEELNRHIRNAALYGLSVSIITLDIRQMDGLEFEVVDIECLIKPSDISQ